LNRIYHYVFIEDNTDGVKSGKIVEISTFFIRSDLGYVVLNNSEEIIEHPIM